MFYSVIAVTTSSAITSAITSKTSKSIPGTKIPGVSSSTWTGFFFKLFLFSGVCVGGYYGWIEYQKRNKYGGGMANFGGMSLSGGGGFGGVYTNPKRF